MAKPNPPKHRRELAAFPVAKGTVYSVGWSPDGTRLVCGDEDANVRVLGRDGTTHWQAKHERGWVMNVAWSPDGACIASAGYDDKTVRVWDAATGQEQRLFRESSPVGAQIGIAWAPDGSELAWIREASPAAVRVFDARTWSLLRERSFPEHTFRRLTQSPDGQRLAVFSQTGAGSALILSATTLDTERELFGARVNHLAWSPDSTRLAGAGYQPPGALILWDALRGGDPQMVTCDPGTCVGVGWSPDGNVIATGGGEGFVALWSPDRLTELDRLTGHTRMVWFVAFSPTGGLLATGAADGTLRLWDVSDLVPERKTEKKIDRVSVYLSRQALTVGRRPRNVATPADRWVPTSLPGADPARKLLGYLKEGGPRVDLAPDERAAFVLRVGTQMSRWDLQTGTRVWELATSSANLGCEVRVSPDGARVAVATDKPLVIIHDAVTGQELAQWPTGNDTVRAVAWSPDGKHLAAGAGGLVWLWDADGRLRHTFSLASGRDRSQTLDALCWSPDGSALAAGNTQGTVCVWDLRLASPVDRWDVAGSGINTRVWGLAWSPDGTRLASSGEARTVEVRDAATGELRATGRGLGEPIYKVAWSPDSRLIASASFLAVQVFDARTGAAVEVFKPKEGSHGHNANRLSWGRSGAFLLVGGHDGTRVWDTRHLMPETPLAAMRSSGPTTPLPSELVPLPPSLAALHRVAVQPPLSAVRDALALANGQAPPPGSPLAELASHPALPRLAALRWPASARPALAAFLLKDIPHGEPFAPPPELPPAELARLLAEALTDATDCPPETPPTPAAPARAALDSLTDRAVGLLKAAGHAAAEIDPGLVARLVAAAEAGVNPNRAGASGIVRVGGNLGGGSWGSDRSGLSTRGDWRSVCPSQWAMPPAVLATRARRGEVLFRTAKSTEAGDRPPVVVVLDASPAAWGAVGGALRAAAAAVLEGWWRAGRPAWVLAAGGEERVWEVRSPADWARVWTSRDPDAADGSRAVRVADRVRRGLGWTGGVLLVLSHVWFGDGLPRVGRVAGILARPKGGRGSGPRGWADRWAEVPADAGTAVAAANKLLAAPWG